MKFGLTDKELESLSSIFSKKLSSGNIYIYGSRAKGNYTSTSDIDLVIKGSQALSTNELAEIEDAIIESDIPYLCDIQYLENISNQALLEHIARIGKLIYETIN